MPHKTHCNSNVFVATVIPEFQDNDMPKDVNATEGGSVSISCRTYAVPQATVQWFKNGEPLQGMCAPHHLYLKEFRSTILFRRKEIC